MAIIVGCGSSEEPLAGTSLVTYKKNGKIGVKEAGKEGQIIIYPKYLDAEVIIGFLFMKTDSKVYDVYGIKGKEICKNIEIVEKGETYAIIRYVGKTRKRLVVDDGIFSEVDDIFAFKNNDHQFIFLKLSGRWWQWNVLDAEYDKIIVVHAGKDKPIYYLGHMVQFYNMKEWEILTPDVNRYGRGKIVKSITKEEFTNIQQNLSKPSIENVDGTISLYEFDISPYIQY
jgi:hypothetical protein